MNTTTTLFLRSDPAMYTSPGRTYIYARVDVRDPARMYVRGRIFFLAPSPPYVCVSRRLRRRPYVHIRGRIFFLAPWPPLLRHVRASTATNIYVRTHSRPERQGYVRFDQVGPDCQALPCVRRCSWWVPAVRGEMFFFAKYCGPSGGSLLSGGGIIIFRVIMRHFLAAAVYPAVSLSTYSPCPMEVVP